MELRFPLILDGATGTELQKRGYTGDVSAEQWVLAHPDSILSIQRDYVAAGSQVLYTPTFGGNAVKLAEHGVTEDTAAYNRRLADPVPSGRGRQGPCWPATCLPPACFWPLWAAPPSTSWWTPTPNRQPDWKPPVWTCTSLRP